MLAEAGSPGQSAGRLKLNAGRRVLTVQVILQRSESAKVARSMRQPVLVAVVGTAGVLCAGIAATYLAWKHPAYAEVVSVEPVKQVVTTPEKICGAEPVARPTRVEDQTEYLTGNPGLGGRVISGMGRLPVRSGSGGTVASGTPDRRAAQTVNKAPGTAHNGKAGKAGKAAAATHKQCRTVQQMSERVVAYDVRYRLHGRTSKVRMDYDPGTRIPVKDGKLVLRKSAGDGSELRG